MTETDNQVPDSNDNAAPQQEPVAETASAPVDLAAEAGQAAAVTPPPTEGRVRSLDDLDVDGAVRAQIESYVSKSVNEAVAKHDERQQRKLDDEGFMNKAQIEQLLETKDAEYARREQAKDTFLTVLGLRGSPPVLRTTRRSKPTIRRRLTTAALLPTSCCQRRAFALLP